MAEVLGWADVLFLPSRWEGAPLAVLEAQRLGCVPIATDVGAVAELIADGQDGILLHDGPDAAVAGVAFETLLGLDEDRVRLARLSSSEAARTGDLDWVKQVAPLLDRLATWFPQCAIAGSGSEQGPDHAEAGVSR